MNATVTWFQIVRLGLVQASIGAIVVFATSTLNRVMVVELALPAIVPGSLVAFHYAVQMLRPRWGYGSDRKGRRTPWIIGGMGVLATGNVLAALATATMKASPMAGFALALVGFSLIGIGVGASGTSLLVLLAKQVDERRRAAAATVVWMMMIAGFIVAAGIAGRMLDPFSIEHLVAASAVIAGSAVLITIPAVWNVEAREASSAAPWAARSLTLVLSRVRGTRVERPGRPLEARAGCLSSFDPPGRRLRTRGAEVGRSDRPPGAPAPSFRAALGAVWAEPEARRFTLFVFLSMLAYSAQELVIEPFAGSVFGLSPAESAKLAGLQHSGLLAGMLAVALIGSLLGGPRLGSMRLWTTGGCIASALAILGLAATGFSGSAGGLRLSIFALGLANGGFSIAAIAAMMQLAGAGGPGREGVRMGLWGAAQALAFALGGLLGTSASDLARHFLGSADAAYALIFFGEAVLFCLAAGFAGRAFPSTSASIAEPTRHCREPSLVAATSESGR